MFLITPKFQYLYTIITVKTKLSEQSLEMFNRDERFNRLYLIMSSVEVLTPAITNLSLGVAKNILCIFRNFLNISLNSLNLYQPKETSYLQTECECVCVKK